MNELLHNEKVQAYLDSLCAQVRCREVHAEIREELLSHIADRVEALMESGVAETEAVAQALRQLGDPDVVGRQLHQLHRPRLDWWLLGAMAALVCVGLWAMYAVDVSGSFYNRYLGLIQQQLQWAVIGLGAGAMLTFFDYRRLRRLSWPLFGLTFLATVIVTLADTQRNGRPIFLDLSPLLYVPALAGIFADWDWGAARAAWKALAVFAIPAAIYMIARWYFPMCEFLLLAGVLLMASKPRRAQVALLAAAGAVAAGLMTQVIEPYHLERLVIWLHPYSDPQGAGYQIVQALESVKHAGLWGQGALASLPALPGTHTDFVFPYLVYTLGWLAGTALCLLVLLFTIRLMQAGRGVRDRYGSFLLRGIAALFMLHFGWNLLMTVGLLPMFSVGLPFVSLGSQQAIYLALVGLALSVFRRKTTTAKI